MSVTVALPVLDGGPLLGEVLAAVRAQEVDRPVELLVIDSGSTRRLARSSPAATARAWSRSRAAEFSHGGTRNRLMELATGDHVAFLTQDSVPARPRLARRRCSAASRWPTTWRWCAARTCRGPTPARWSAASCASTSRASAAQRVDRGDAAPGPATFFSSANGAVARWAWERVPFRAGRLRRGPAARARHARRRPREGVRAGGRGRALARPPAAAGVGPLLRRLPRARRGERRTASR